MINNDDVYYLKLCYALIDEYIKAEESKKNVELTLEQVAEKFNINVDKLRIKD